MIDADLIAGYDRSAVSYQRWWAPVIAPAALRVLDLVDEAVVDTADALVVDVGAGTGTLARGAVQRWPMARVIAFDPSEGMLEIGRAEARRTLPSEGSRRIRWARATADRLQLEDATADAVVSSFALQHLPSRIAGLREAHRVLRPGGLLGVVTWLAEDEDFEPERVLEDLLDELDVDGPGSGRASRPFLSPRGAGSLVRRAGFSRVRSFVGTVEYSWTPESYLDYELNYGEPRVLDALEEPERARVVALARERLHRLPPGAFEYRGSVAYVRGRRRA